jgi:hypothetical protein
MGGRPEMMIRRGSPPVWVSTVVIFWQEEGGCQVKFEGKMLVKEGREVIPLFEGVESVVSVIFGLAILELEKGRIGSTRGERMEIPISREGTSWRNARNECLAGAPFDQHVAYSAYHSM